MNRVSNPVSLRSWGTAGFLHPHVSDGDRVAESVKWHCTKLRCEIAEARSSPLWDNLFVHSPERHTFFRCPLLRKRPTMRRSIDAFLAVLALGLLSNSLLAQEPIQMARTPDISPDGKLVAFSYLGDIWVVETIGGKARQVTMHKAHEINPVFSPDGHSIAFSSNRHGSYNVFVIPVDSGKPQRLTFDSANDLVTGWSPDGKAVPFPST